MTETKAGRGYPAQRDRPTVAGTVGSNGLHSMGTEAGQQFLHDDDAHSVRCQRLRTKKGWNFCNCGAWKDIDAIEREAAAQERERLLRRFDAMLDADSPLLAQLRAILAEPSDGSGLDEPPHAGYYVGGPDGGEE